MTKLEAQYQDLQKASARLKEAVELPPTVIHQDATIQRFEFTFELCWKLLNTIARENGIDVYGPRNSFRAAAKLGIIDNPAGWFEFLTARNYTAHIYNEETAQWVYSKAKEFTSYVDSLITNVKQYVSKNP